MVTNFQPCRPMRGILFVTFLLLFSSLAQAAFQGAAGEAVLVPFVMYDSSHGINTTIKITVPVGVYESRIPNEFTAPHTSPSGGDLSTQNTVNLRYIFFNESGEQLYDNYLEIYPDSIAQLNWGAVAPFLSGTPGYLLLQTKNGFQGLAADYNIFADVTMTVGNRAVNIPTYALADGEDTIGGLPIEGSNEVLKDYPGSPLYTSIYPLASGIRTGAIDEPKSKRTHFDLLLGRRTRAFSLFSFFGQGGPEPTLLVVWNDGNYSKWDWTPVDVYNEDGTYCSDMIQLGKHLNLIWVQPNSLTPINQLPGVTYQQFCTAGATFPVSNGPRYVKVSLPSTQTNSASVAFSIILGASEQLHLARERGRVALEK